MRKPFFVVLSVLFVLFACTKIETTDIGNGLIPPIDGLNTKDTFFDVVTNTHLDNDIARIYKSDDHVIGVITNDPVFGKTTASTFFELKPTAYKFSFPGNKDSLRVDSAVLVLSYKGVYGDSTIPQTWDVFEINNNDKLKFDSTYGATSEISYGTKLGSRNLDIRSLNDSVNYGFENAINQVRIKLDNSFANRLIKQYDSTSGKAYESDSLFRENFAGFAVVPTQSSGNALVRINLLDTNTKLSLYYSTRVAIAAKRDTLVSYFRFNSSGGSATSGSANLIKRERMGSQVASAVNSGQNDSVIYIQTSPGTFATVDIPNLPLFRNAIIHRAEIVAIPASDNNPLDAILSPPRYLLLTAYDSLNKQKVNVRNDYEISTEGPNLLNFGGLLINRTAPGYTGSKAYVFNLTRYVQGIVTRHDISYPLRIYAPSNDSLLYTPPYPIGTTPTQAYISPANANNIADGRVRLYGGGGQTQLRMRLRIIYSEL